MRAVVGARRVRAALTIWRGRRERGGGEIAYALYAFSLVAAIVILPAARAMWVLALSSLENTATAGLLFMPSFLPVFLQVVAVLWVCSLLVGSKRGPALLPPFLLYALAGGAIRRSIALRRPMLRSAAVIVAVCAGAAVLLGAVLFNGGVVQLWPVVVLVTASVAVGVVAAVLWLLGQVFPRAALPMACTVVIFAFATWEWGWVFGLAIVCVLAAVSICMFSVLLNLLLDRLRYQQLVAQATRWERATAFSYSFDFQSASAVYETNPRFGRGIRAVVRSRRLGSVFFIRDMIGFVRAPGRALGGVVMTAVAGMMMTLSFAAEIASGVPAVFLAVAAGVLIYLATGRFTRGLQHAARVAGDYPLYGISDRRLVLFHMFFPFSIILLVLSIAAIVTSLFYGLSFGSSLVVALAGAYAVGSLSIALRLANALKGPLPPSLLTPISTPVGDLSVLMQLGWACSELLIAALGAMSAAMLPGTPIPLTLAVIITMMLVWFRWKKRG